MACKSKEVQINVRTKTDCNSIESLEKKLQEAKKIVNELNKKKIQLAIDAKTTLLEKIKDNIKSLEAMKISLGINEDTSQLEFINK